MVVGVDAMRAMVHSGKLLAGPAGIEQFGPQHINSARIKQREKAMIIDGPDSVTKAVLAEIAHAPNPRFREVMTALVKHLHAFVREVKLSEEEFHQACAIINSIGQSSNSFHNEAVLMSGSLGVSTLVCLLNNGDERRDRDHREPAGPFWRLDSPRTENGGSIIRSPTPGPELFVNILVQGPRRQAGRRRRGRHLAILDRGLYENQDPTQADMNLRGKFTTDATAASRSAASSRRAIRSRSTGRSAICCRRRAATTCGRRICTFLIYKPGFKTHISQVYLPDDPNIETDVQFGVTKRLLGDFVRHDDKPPAPGVKTPWYSLDYTFIMDQGGEAAARADPGQGDVERDAAAIFGGSEPPPELAK
jgi:catechol 1,2-dioxygenase